jgi:beta-phosphoglucomutase-like phosphatase (HAD superfamily)
LSAAESLAIEDSVHGVTAAKSIGMRVLAVQTQSSAEALAAADVVVPNLGFISCDDVAVL